MKYVGTVIIFREKIVITMRFGHLTGGEAYRSTGSMHKNFITSSSFSSENIELNWIKLN